MDKEEFWKQLDEAVALEGESDLAAESERYAEALTDGLGMSAMDEVFGTNPHRPSHPDLWRISEVLLRIDGAIEQAADRGAAWNSIVDPVVDLDSVLWMAEQRVLRVFGQVEDAGLKVKLLALVLDAFVVGAMFQTAGGHRPEGEQG